MKPSRWFSCDRCVTRKGYADELWRIHTWYGATRLAAREELADRAPTQTYSTAPFQPTDRTTDRTVVGEQVHHPCPRFIRAAAAISCHPPTLGRPLDVHPYLPLDLSQVRIDAVGILSGPTPVGHFIYMRINTFLFILISQILLLGTRFEMRYEAQNNVKACWGNNVEEFWERFPRRYCKRRAC